MSGNQNKRLEIRSMKQLLEEPKGQLDYYPDEAFMLHVFWEAPSLDAARRLLAGLKGCAVATHRDTPCVPTYFFRISEINSGLCGPTPMTIGDHPQLRAAKAKIDRGVPRPAVHADVSRRGLDVKLLDLALDAELPVELRTAPVAVELTEIYLDERAFNLHAGSRDYLDSYGVVMQPGLANSQPTTVRFGTPIASLIEKILEPILHEQPLPLHDQAFLFHRPSAQSTGGGDGAIFLSLDVPLPGGQDAAAGAAVAATLPPTFLQQCTTCVSFTHPLRPETARLISILPSLTPPSLLSCLTALQPLRGEAFLTSADQEAVEAARAALGEAGLGEVVTVNATEAVGYVLHEKAAELHPCVDVA